MARKIAVVCVWLGLASPLGVHALGLGDIHVRSALNQPLDAEIELISAAPGELENLEVALAPRETFDRYGIDRPSMLSGLEFEVARSTGGEGVLRVTSAGPVSEPFLTFLIEAKWPRGRLLREYTVLLDPPVYLPDERRAEPSPARAEPERETEARASGPISRPAAVTDSAQAASPRAAAMPATGGEYGPVVRNETLWTIANRLRSGSGITVNQMMIALYRANPDAFNDNINLLRAGAVLRVPDAAAFDALQASAATAEVARQNSEWQEGRQAAAPPRAAAAEPAGARLRLVAPEGEDSGTAAAGTGPAAADDESETLRRQVTELQSQLEETQRLLEVKDSELAAMQARLAEQQPAAAGSETPGAPGVDLETEAADDAPAATAPVAAAPKPATVRDSGGVLDGVMALLGSTWLYVGLGIALLLATMLIFARRRREPARPAGRWHSPDADAERASPAAVGRTQRLRSLPDEDESIVVVEQGARARRATPAVPAARAAREPEAAAPAVEEEDTLSSATAIHLDHADPLAEADFHMAYGLYDQAAALVRAASENEPERRDLHMKLLEIYFVWGNEQGFLDEARRLHDSMAGNLDADWDKTLIMGKQICPDEKLFATEPGGGARSIDLDLADSGAGTATVDFATGGAEGTALDMDLGDTGGKQRGDSGDTLKIVPEGALDFDFGRDDTAETRRQSSKEGSTVEASGFDSPTVETPTLEQPGPESPTLESPTLESARYEDPTMETPTLEQRIESALESGGADQTAEIDLDDLGLDLEDLRDETLGGPLDDDEATLLAGAPDFASRKDEGESDDFDPGLTTPAPGSMARDRDATAEVPHFGSAGARDLDATSELDSLDIDIEDLSAALEAGETEVQPAPAGGDTVRQPRYPGAERRGRDPSLDEDLTEILTEEDDAFTAARDFDLGDIGDSDGESEVGTKLDLARAYMDMGDPEGAQSILQEVVEEGDSSQREEAERLLKALP